MTKRNRILAALLFTGMAALLPGCATTPVSIAKVEFKGPVRSSFQNDASIISQDGGQSFPTPGGSLWTFGDTFLGSRDENGTPHFKGGGIFCSIAFLPKKDEQSFPPALRYKTGPDGAAVSPLSLLPGEKPGHDMIWPLAGVYANGKYYLYYTRVHKTGGGMWDFREVGSGLAECEKPLGEYRRLRPGGDWRFPVAPTQVLKAGPWLYLYEIVVRGDERGAGLARVKAAEIGSPAAYEYYHLPDESFRKEKSAQSILVPAAGQVSAAFDPYCQCWLMATSSDLFHPRRISLYRAPAPEGPWECAGRIQVPEFCQGKQVTLAYCTYLHPELFRENGKVIALTFSVHLEDGGFDANCEMAEITLERR